MSAYDHLDRDALIRLLQRRDADAALAAMGDPCQARDIVRGATPMPHAERHRKGPP